MARRRLDRVPWSNCCSTVAGRPRCGTSTEQTPLDIVERDRRFITDPAQRQQVERMAELLNRAAASTTSPVSSHSMTDILVRQALVRDGDPPVDIAIANGRIAAIDRRIDTPARRVIDAAGRATLPGLLEPHIHLDKALLESRMPNRSGTLDEAIRVTGQLKREQTREDVLDRSRHVLDMAMRHGTVALRCQPDVDPIQGLLGVETALQLQQEYARAGRSPGGRLPAGRHPQVARHARVDARKSIGLGATSSVAAVPTTNGAGTPPKAHIDTVFDLAQRHGLRHRHARRLRRRRGRPALLGGGLHRAQDDRHRLPGPRHARARHQSRLRSATTRGRRDGAPGARHASTS